MGNALRARRRLILVAAGLIVASLVLYRCTPLAELATPERLEQLASGLRGSPWAPLIVIGVYVAAGAIEFPVVLLIGATATLFAPLAAAGLSMAGALASAVVFYWIGARLARGQLHDALGPTLGKVSAMLDRSGVIAIVVMRSVPFAPFTVVNLASGAAGIRFFDYVIGTALGLAPGIIAMTAFGSQLKALWGNPSVPNLARLLAIAIAWIAVVVLMQRLSRRWRARRRGTP